MGRFEGTESESEVVLRDRNRSAGRFLVMKRPIIVHEARGTDPRLSSLKWDRFEHVPFWGLGLTRSCIGLSKRA